MPHPESVEGLIIMGGPMSVNDEAEYPWLSAEKRFARDVIEAGKPVLGVCLGAQLIASALGARVYRNAEKEIGWFPVEGLASEDPAVYRFPPSALAFHWHGETFDLPVGASRIARSAACENQAFQLGSTTLGLQFHLETTRASARSLVEHCRDELRCSAFIQSEEAILSAGDEDYAALNREMARVLAFLFPLAGARR
jgi:GMP synthase-like glutamine amidotransferase